MPQKGRKKPSVRKIQQSLLFIDHITGSSRNIQHVKGKMWHFLLCCVGDRNPLKTLQGKQKRQHNL